MAALEKSRQGLVRFVRAIEPEPVLKHVFGSLRKRDLLFVVALLMSLGWLTDSLYNFFQELLMARLGGSAEVRRVWAWALLSLPFGVLLLIAAGLRRKARSQPPPLFQEVDNPQVAALILFLSRPREDQVASSREHNAKLSGTLDDPEVLDAVRGPWQLPLVSIARHRALRAVLLVDSEGPEGSRAVRAEFEALLRQLAPRARFELLAAEDLLPALAGGLDFFDVRRLAGEITAMAAALAKRLAVQPAELLIDVNSATKAVTIAATRAAIAEGLLLNFVDPRTYLVSPLRMELEAEGKGAGFRG